MTTRHAPGNAGATRDGRCSAPTGSRRSRRASGATYAGPSVFPYDARGRVFADLQPLDGVAIEVGTGDGHPTRMLRFARGSFELFGDTATLDVFWLDQYGGGIYLAFRDATSGGATYGGGRYLLDTVKGADLGEADGRGRAVARRCGSWRAGQRLGTFVSSHEAIELRDQHVEPRLLHQWCLPAAMPDFARIDLHQGQRFLVPRRLGHEMTVRIDHV